VILPEGHSTNITFSNLEAALASPDTHLRLFGKPEVKGRRRMGVVACRAETIDKARETARKAAASVQVGMG
jgi:phosphoribosylglycinamide formyltransferase 2